MRVEAHGLRPARRRSAAICVVVLSVAYSWCGVSDGTIVATGTVTETDYLVYQTVLDRLCENSEGRALGPVSAAEAALIIRTELKKRESAIETEWLRSPKPWREKLLPGTITSLRSRLAGGGTFEPRFEVPGGYVLVGMELLDRLPDDSIDRWQALEQRFPKAGGILVFSPVGYSQDGTQALLFMVHSYGSLGSERMAVLLRRVEDRWVIEGVQTLSVS